MIIHDVAQRSEEWFALRLGRATASRASDMIATGRGGKGVGATQTRYLTELVTEQLTGQTAERPFSTSHTRRGQDLEQEALLAWEARTGRLVMPVGFVSHDTLMAGCSPDGLVYKDGLTIQATMEVKCPIQAIHYPVLEKQEILDKTHRTQLLHSIVLTGAQVGIYISYCVAFHPPDDLVALEYVPAEGDVEAYAVKLLAFCEQVTAAVDARKPLRQQLEASLKESSVGSTS